MTYRKDFIRFCLDNGIIRFGRFTLKSGRESPYFVNTGLFDSGVKLARLGEFYAQAIMEWDIDFDMLYGPAYKGIPLVCATSIALAKDYRRDIPYSFNRKEAKDHGEGGVLLGSPLKGKVLIIDDVITAGTSVNESVVMIRAAGAQPVGVMISVNRQERGAGQLSAIQEIERRHAIKAYSIADLDTLIETLGNQPGFEGHLDGLRDYRKQYGEALDYGDV